MNLMVTSSVAEQLLNETLHVFGRNPTRAQAGINFGRRQILGLHGFQRLDVFLEARFGDAGGFRNLKFFAHIRLKDNGPRFPTPGFGD